jgi:hypothetical protein
VQTHAAPQEPSYWHHPVEDLEPDESSDAYREASKRLMTYFTRVMDRFKSNTVLWWANAFAYGLPHCEGRTMTEIAAALGVSRATLSKEATEICRRDGLSPSFYMKSEEAQASYRTTRKEQISQQ